MSNALSSAISGLKVSQRALDVASSNISNASTVGYTRKILPQESVTISGQAAGVLSGQVYRNVDKYLVIAEQNQISISGYYETKSYYLDRVMQFHSSSDSLKGIATKIGSLENSFINLTSAPNSSEALSSVITNAQAVVSEFNNFSNLINNLRSQTEDAIKAATQEINAALDLIAKLNSEITKLESSGNSYAELEDQRDMAVKTISQYLDVNTYYEDQKLVVMTKQGTTLVDSFAHHLNFSISNITASKYYPNTLNGLFIDSEDVTTQNLGGKIGALLELRDADLPRYQAQVDELAQKLSYRLASQGVQLFNDPYGNVPDNSEPPTSTSYVGYAGLIQVNKDIINNPSLLRHGTTGNLEPDGSVEVLMRITKYAFGANLMQQAIGNVDISGMANISTTLGMTTNNRVTGNQIVSTYPDFTTLPNVADLPADFDITLAGIGTQTITIEDTDNATSLINKINTAFGATIASLNSSGALAFNHNGNITFTANATGPSTNGLSVAAFADLGHTFGVKNSPNPSFTLQLGTRNPVTIEILPTDDDVALLAKINAIDGLTATLNVDGYLVITPDNGGDLTILNQTGTPLDALGMYVNNIAHTSFRSSQVGPNATSNLSTLLTSRNTLSEFASSIVSNQAENARLAESRYEQEESYRQSLETRNASISGVNIDEEMAELIRIQANYSAAAQMISTIIKMFDTLLNAFN